MNEVSINAIVTGGTAGIVGAQVVNIENFNLGVTSPVPAQERGSIPPCPYPGLQFFLPEDCDRFFGREKAVEALVQAVARRTFTALIGPSGSGKSSVVLAGLAPKLHAQGGWRFAYFRVGTEPDRNPFAALARALAPLLGDGDLIDRLARGQKLAEYLASGLVNPANVVAQCRAANPGKRLLLIADQFEELFTSVTNNVLRERYIDLLIQAFPDPAIGVTPDVCLMLTMRADFYSSALAYGALADKLQNRVEYMGAMTRDELRAAIVKPALAVGVEFEPGLVEAVLDDVERSPGGLPLLQFALREMWKRLK
jgi:energy-coupling factor transporter ATP-binding protein EcfA2